MLVKSDKNEKIVSNYIIMRCKSKTKSGHKCNRNVVGKRKNCWQHGQKGGSSKLIKCNRSMNRDQFLCDPDLLCNKDRMKPTVAYDLYNCSPINGYCKPIVGVNPNFVCKKPIAKNVTDKELVRNYVNSNRRYAIYTREFEQPAKNFKPSELNYVGNPSGLWYACGDSWLKFLNRTGFRDICCWLYLVEMNKSANIKKITDFNDLVRFSKLYAKNEWRGTGEFVKIDWEAVKEDGYDGIETCPAFDIKRMWDTYKINNTQLRLTLWYHGFENIDSGVVWNVNAIKNKLFAYRPKSSNRWNIYSSQ